MIKCNDNKAAPLRFGPNLRVKFYERCNISGSFYRRAIGAASKMDEDFRKELLMVENEDGSVSMLYGTGHMRLSCKDWWRQELGTQTPTFDAVCALYAAHDEIEKQTIKDKVIRI